MALTNMRFEIEKIKFISLKEKLKSDIKISALKYSNLCRAEKKSRLIKNLSFIVESININLQNFNHNHHIDNKNKNDKEEKRKNNKSNL